MGAKKDMIGLRFGLLVVLCENGRSKKGEILWKCRCDCGNEVTVDGCNLRRKKRPTRSCGCLAVDSAKHRNTKHGLTNEHWKLYDSIAHHFVWIRTKLSGYRYWTIDERYTGEGGVSRFCYDLIALQPEMCERYELDGTLDLDKDNSDGHIFCPECVRFVSSAENRSKKPNNLFLQDDTKTRFVDFLKLVGIPTRINGKKNPQYDNARSWFKKYNGEGHPELIKRANELIALFTKCLNLLKLRDDVRSFASVAGIPLRSTPQ